MELEQDAKKPYGFEEGSRRGIIQLAVDQLAFEDIVLDSYLVRSEMTLTERKV